jgi:hypothetical protein
MNAANQPSSLVYLFAALLWCGLAIKMIVLRPIASSLFEEFGVALPTLTLWLIHPLQSFLFAGSAAAVLLAGVIADTSQQRRRIGSFALPVGIAGLLLIAIGIGLPLLRLMQSLST